MPVNKTQYGNKKKCCFNFFLFFILSFCIVARMFCHFPKKMNQNCKCYVSLKHTSSHMLIYLWCVNEAQPRSNAVNESTSLLDFPQSFSPLLQYTELWFGSLLWKEKTVERFGVEVFEEGNIQETLFLDNASGSRSLFAWVRG